jgi:hypothetical protein
LGIRSQSFSNAAQDYLGMYPDIVGDAWTHFKQNGSDEGRIWPGPVPEGATIKCSFNSSQLYRYSQSVRRLYINSSILESWGANDSSYVTIPCMNIMESSWITYYLPPTSSPTLSPTSSPTLSPTSSPTLSPTTSSSSHNNDTSHSLTNSSSSPHISILFYLLSIICAYQFIQQQ